MSEKQLLLYVAFRRIKNFVTVVLWNKSALLLYLKLDPDTIEMESGFTRSMKGKGHWGTGDLEVRVSDKATLKKAQALIVRSYEEG